MNRRWKISAFALLLGAGLCASAHADEPFWSLSVGTPGLVANLGNVLPAPPVVVAPPVVYSPPPQPVYYAPPQPVYYPQTYVAQPAYGLRRPERWHRWHHEDGGDGGWHHDH